MTELLTLKLCHSKLKKFVSQSAFIQKPFLNFICISIQMSSRKRWSINWKFLLIWNVVAKIEVTDFDVALRINYFLEEFASTFWKLIFDQCLLMQVRYSFSGQSCLLQQKLSCKMRWRKHYEFVNWIIYEKESEQVERRWHSVCFVIVTLLNLFYWNWTLFNCFNWDNCSCVIYIVVYLWVSVIAAGENEVDLVVWFYLQHAKWTCTNDARRTCRTIAE